MVCEELARTLSFFEGGLDVEGRTFRHDSRLVSLQAPKPGKKAAFVSFSSEDEQGTPLLFPAQSICLPSAWRSTRPRCSKSRASPCGPFSGGKLKPSRVPKRNPTRFCGSLGLRAKLRASSSNRILGAKPLEMLATDAGAHGVEAELNRIELGDYA